MRREDLRRLFARARELCGETDYMVLGSLAILGCAGEVPPRMAASIDVDAYSKSDPDLFVDLVPALGQGSPFERELGYYLDPISPRVATLPAGWEGRRDREWIRPGLRAGVLSLAIRDGRFAETAFLDTDEAARDLKALEEDRRWLRAKRA